MGRRRIQRPFKEAHGEGSGKDVRNRFVSVEKTKEQYEVVTDLILFKTSRKEGRERRAELKLVGHTSKYQICPVGLVLVSPREKGSVRTTCGGKDIVV